MRSRLPDRRCDGLDAGITSACAEQTGVALVARLAPKDHLRVCGADLKAKANKPTFQGSPPRVRSRRIPRDRITAERRITSACAEQTPRCLVLWRLPRDHLRVCGADLIRRIPETIEPGSPPRVRSRRCLTDIHDLRCGITSACAEQTSKPKDWRMRTGDHLRVCGADRGRKGGTLFAVGSPPRVRSRLHALLRPLRPLGITSACAEQTVT